MRSKTDYTQEEANQIIELIRLKLESNSAKQKGIRSKIRRLGFYASDFNLRGGYTEHDFLRVVKVGKINYSLQSNSLNSKTLSRSKAKPDAQRAGNDESYVIDLCDEALKTKGNRQHRFDFLRGDAGTKLPVDVYYPKLNLVIEYREKQHTESVKLFDKRQTISGVSQGEQRKLYDQKRREVLPQHGIYLIEIGYDDFEYDSSKRIKRHRATDQLIVITKLRELLKSK